MNRWALVYDGACGFCRWSAARVLRLDRRGRLRAVPLADPSIPSLLATVAEPDRATSWHLVSPEGVVRSAGAAVAPLLRLLPALRWLAWLPAATPRLTERAYRWVARNRASIGAFLGEERCDVVPGR